MPWNDTARRDHARPASRYASDLTNREWRLIAPFLPPPRRQGRPRSADMREVMNAILWQACIIGTQIPVGFRKTIALRISAAIGL